MRPDTVIYYAQLLQPRAGYPTARVLQGTVLRTQPGGKLRLKHPSTKWGLEADPAHCSTDPLEAQAHLTARIAAEISHHELAIQQLKHAEAVYWETSLLIF